MCHTEYSVYEYSTGADVVMTIATNCNKSISHLYHFKLPVCLRETSKRQQKLLAQMTKIIKTKFHSHYTLVLKFENVPNFSFRFGK